MPPGGIGGSLRAEEKELVVSDNYLILLLRDLGCDIYYQGSIARIEKVG